MTSRILQTETSLEGMFIFELKIGHAPMRKGDGGTLWMTSLPGTVFIGHTDSVLRWMKNWGENEAELAWRMAAPR